MQSHCRQVSPEPEFLKGTIHVFCYAESVAQHTEMIQQTCLKETRERIIFNGEDGSEAMNCGYLFNLQFLHWAKPLTFTQCFTARVFSSFLRAHRLLCS